MNVSVQTYKGIELKLILRNSYVNQHAKRFALGGTNQNVWIPNKHLEEDGTIRKDADIDYVFRNAQRQLELAGYDEAIPGIKRRTIPLEKGVTDIEELTKLNQSGRCRVKYVGKAYASFFGNEPYEAKSRSALLLRINGVRTNASWYIVVPYGDNHTIARNSLMDDMEKDWIVVGAAIDLFI